MSLAKDMYTYLTIHHMWSASLDLCCTAYELCCVKLCTFNNLVVVSITVLGSANLYRGVPVQAHGRSAYNESFALYPHACMS